MYCVQESTVAVGLRDRGDLDIQKEKSTGLEDLRRSLWMVVENLYL